MVKGPPVEQQQRGGRGRRRVAKWNKDVRIDDLLDGSNDEESKYRSHSDEWPKVGEVPTFRASDTDTDLPIVSVDLSQGF